jgi:hypothetical protein
MDMVSAACPKCKILVVQAENNTGEGLFLGQQAAAKLGAAVISNSWGGPESAGVDLSPAEPYFDQPGVAIFVAAGDDGFNDGGEGPDYPGTSAHTISVGGTRLVKDASARGWAETAWSKGGSACSLQIAKPAYQTASPCAFKATADIAAVGDPSTGLAVYNKRNGGWITLGGTSAAAPFIAAIYAATNRGGETSGAFLSANTDKLHDVTSGRNGMCGSNPLLCTAGVGWDGPTGYGTPNARALMPEGVHADEADDGGCAAAGSGAGLLGGLFGLAGAGVLARGRRRRRGC